MRDLGAWLSGAVSMAVSTGELGYSWNAGSQLSRKAGPFLLNRLLSVLESGALRAKDVGCFLNGYHLHPDYYSSANGLEVRRLEGLYASGATVRLTRVERYVAELRRAISRHGAVSWFNCYISPVGSLGLGAHSDAHDIIVLQLAGEKSWDLWGKDASEGSGGRATSDLGSPSQRLRLRHGDCLFLARGVVHRASTTGPMSAHLAWGTSEPIGKGVAPGSVESRGQAPSVERLASRQERTSIIRAAAILAGHSDHGFSVSCADGGQEPSSSGDVIEFPLEGGTSIRVGAKAYATLRRLVRVDPVSEKTLLEYFEAPALYMLLTALVAARRVEIIPLPPTNALEV